MTDFNDDTMIIIMRFINSLFYFGSGLVNTRPLDHFKAATILLSGMVFQDYKNQFDAYLRIQMCHIRIARMYALANQQEKETLKSLMSINSIEDKNATQAQRKLAEADTIVKTSDIVGSAGPAVSTLLVTNSEQFAEYVEACFINWIGHSRTNSRRGNLSSVQKTTNQLDVPKEQRIVVVHLFGQLLSTCSQAIFEIPVRLFSGAIFSIYSEHTPCFHRYGLLKKGKGELSAFLPPSKQQIDKNLPEFKGAESIENFNFPPTNITLIPVDWPYMPALSKNFTIDVCNKIKVKLISIKFLKNF